MIEIIETYKATVSFTAPTAYRAMLAAMEEGADLSSLRAAVSAGETLPAPVYEAWMEKTGKPMLDGIGATELLHIFITNRFGDSHPACTGRPVKGYEAKIVDDDMNELPPGTIGKLAVRGPTGCRYLADERQVAYVRDGWNLTGDSFWRDDDGYFHFAARSDDMIVSSGYNIAGPEVEAALLAHPDVVECGVIGVPDEARGQIVQAHVVLAEHVPACDATKKHLQDLRQSDDRPLQISALDRVHRCAAENPDRQDPAFPSARGGRPMTDFSATKARFQLPAGVVYLDGNSLGPLPKHATEHVRKMMTAEWGEMLIRGWNQAGWMIKPRQVGDRIGRLIGAPKDAVVMGDTLSIKVYQALAAALDMRRGRKIVLSDTGNFPTDLYMAEGLIRSLDRGHALKTVAPTAVEAAIDDSVAVLLLTHVDYRTGRMHDMERLTRKAHAAGALVIWDLAHSAGAVPVDLDACQADVAVGCTYKFLNGGPGAPAFIYVRPDHAEHVRPALSGWLGHEAPFAFEPDYRPAVGIERMRVGTPPIIQLACLEAALDIFDDVDMQAVRQRSIELAELFIRETEKNCPMLTLVSPRDPRMRGSQVSFAFEHGYAAMQALIAHDVIGDFRAPDIMRFGITPLYVDEQDVRHAVDVMARVLE